MDNYRNKLSQMYISDLMTEVNCILNAVTQSQPLPWYNWFTGVAVSSFLLDSIKDIQFKLKRRGL